jgi:hypothetical protein
VEEQVGFEEAEDGSPKTKGGSEDDPDLFGISGCKIVKKFEITLRINH